ncbi:hypothetical protein PAHAL_2G049300 [Panicum hallii]|uniref:RRM domain-containing protein n=1 Tax=Panicum hallii TaxID=206008 RepID=A0A2S3GVZ9_9POAL|nr:hypothetical protein PAHAL_2G049300 [Panicum hallii]
MSSPGRRTPPLRPWEEPPIPAALLPPKKRWAWLLRTPAVATAPVPTAPPAAPQIHATPGAAAAVTSPLAAPDPAPVAHVDAAAASPPAAAGQKQPTPLPPLAGDQKPYAPPQPAADGKPSTPPPSKMVRKVVRKVRKVVKKIVPKGTTSATAARKETANAAKAASAAVDGASQLQAVADEDQEPGEFVPEKVATYRNNAVAGSQSSLGEETAAEAAAAGELVVEKKLMVSSKGEEREEVGVSGRQKRMREVFVGGLDGDAKEEDVRAALAQAGEITEVRMIMDPNVTTKNRGYCFVRYREAAQARKAIAELGNVKVVRASDLYEFIFHMIISSEEFIFVISLGKFIRLKKK